MASSFDCFEKEFPALAKLGKLAESYCYSDPNGALYKIRKIGETITTLIYEYDSLPVPTGNVSDIPQVSRINALYDSRIINGLLAKSFTRLRKIGNEAVQFLTVFVFGLRKLTGQRKTRQIKNMFRQKILLLLQRRKS